MQSLSMKIWSELRGAWRFRWLAMICAWSVCVLGWMYVYSIPDSFESTAKVYVDTNSALMRYLDKLAVNTNMLSKVEMVTKAMLSRPQLQRVARETDLHLRANSSGQMNEIIEHLMSEVEIKNDPRKEPNLYEIHYIDTDPKISRDVVATLLDIFVEQSLDEDREGSQNAQLFLRAEKEKVSQELQNSELRLAEFKKANVGRLPEQGADYYQRLQAEMTALEKAESNISLADRKRRTLQQQLAGEQSILDVSDSVAVELGARLAEHEKRLEDLQLRFTDQHPDVIALKSTIEQLQERKAQRLNELQNAVDSGVGPAADNPVFQSLQVDLSQVDVELVGLAETANSHRRKIEELRSLIDVLPEVEAELKRLTRDYGAKEIRYEELLRRLEVAELTEAAGQSDNIKIRVIEPPRLPNQASEPNRHLLLSAVLALGLVGGLGVGVAGNRVVPVFQNSAELRGLVDSPVLGQVSEVRFPENSSRRKIQLGIYLAAASVLLMVFGVVSVFAGTGSSYIQNILT